MTQRSLAALRTVLMKIFMLCISVFVFALEFVFVLKITSTVTACGRDTERAAALRTVVGIFSDGSSAALNLTQGDPDAFLLQFLK